MHVIPVTASATATRRRDRGGRQAGADAVQPDRAAPSADINARDSTPTSATSSGMTRATQAAEGGDVTGGDIGAGAMPSCGMAPAPGTISRDVDANLYHQLGLHDSDVQCLARAPPAENVQLVHGCSLPAGASSAARARPAASGSVVVRPVYRSRPAVS
jgi:hypothetical protein